MHVTAVTGIVLFVVSFLQTFYLLVFSFKLEILKILGPNVQYVLEKKALIFSALTAWNNVETELCNIVALKTFKTMVKSNESRLPVCKGFIGFF